MGINLKKFVMNYGRKKVFYDKSFQRRSVWGKKEWNSFASSLTRGWASNPVILLDVEKCKEHCLDLGDNSSAKYFTDVQSQGYKYISLDGQNRSLKIEEFMNNEITITGEFVNADGELVAVENKFFKDLPQRLKDKFSTGCLVSIHEHSDISKHDAGKIFGALNDGMPLNAQEKRNAYPSPISTVVRELSSKYSELYKRVVKEDDISRMGDDELLAKTLMVLFDKYNVQNNKRFSDSSKLGLNAEDIDSFYSIGNEVVSLNDPDCPYDYDEIVKANDILQSVSCVVLNQKTYPSSKVVPAKTYWGIVLLCKYLHNNDFEIFNYEKFMEAYVDLDKQLTVNGETKYSSARTKAIEDGKDPDTVPKNEYYHKWINLPHQHTYRRLRSDALIKNFTSKNLKSFGVRKKQDQIGLFVQAA